MKIKLDFVTNSSSSSFVVLGTDLNLNEILRQNEEKLKQSHECFALSKHKYENMEYLRELANNTGLQISDGGSDYYYDEVSVGFTYEQMKEDETKAEFKERIKEAIKTSFGIDVKELTHIEKCWYDS